MACTNGSSENQLHLENHTPIDRQSGKRIGVGWSVLGALSAFTILYCIYGLINGWLRIKIVYPFPLAWRYFVNGNLPISIDHVINFALAAIAMVFVLRKRRVRSAG